MIAFWKSFPNKKPKSSGWYACCIKYTFNSNKTKERSYVKDLYWEESSQEWLDKDRIKIFESFDVFSKRSNRKLKFDKLCVRNDVVAFMKLPKVKKFK